MKTCAHAQEANAIATSNPNSWLYLLERFDVGIVNLDAQLHVVGMNSYARRSLPVEKMLPFGKIVTEFHPEVARTKVEFLLGQAACPVNNAPPMTMMINMPERILLIKVSKIADLEDVTCGYTLVFYDITDVVSKDALQPLAIDSNGAQAKRQLLKIPTVKKNRVLLVDVANVSFIRSEGHYTWVYTAQGGQFCNITIGDLESRLDPKLFLRVHRSYIVNLSQVDEIERHDGRMTLHMTAATAAKIPVSRPGSVRLMEHLGLSENTETIKI